VAERVMVCLSSKSPNPSSLLRKGARLADRLNAPWYAVYIQTPDETLERIDAATQRQMANTQTLAHQLGGVPMTFKGGDVVSTIATFAREYGITHLLLGRTLRPWYRRWFGQSVLDRLLRTIPGVDVVVVDTT
jgi:two-component system sensor histidine kinase KdpD